MAPEMRNILVVDDEAPMRHMLRLVLEKEGYCMVEAPDAESALLLMARTSFDVVLCDIRMPAMGGVAFLRETSRRQHDSTIIMMSAYGTLDTAIECMKEGAYDYISKPFKNDEVVLTLRKAEERLRLQRENRRLREKIAQREERNMVFRSQVMARIEEMIDRVAKVTAPVLITGETGTGKELVARALHARSVRRDRPFCAVNCSAIAASLMESELFGHAKGAFSGADRERLGLFRATDGGVLFLDEIGELPVELQPKLLRALQEGEVLPVGETKPRPVDVRVVAATARDLPSEVRRGRFREDLFYRLAVIEIQIPPLRERRDDIPVLVEYWLSRIALREGSSPPHVAPEALQRLQDYAWPGNVRELVNFLERTMVFRCGERIDLAALPWEGAPRRGEKESLSLKQASERLEREYIRRALLVTGGNRTQAARVLEISLRGLLYKMKAFGISDF